MIIIESARTSLVFNVLRRAEIDIKTFV